MSDFLPKVDNFPTTNSVEKSSVKIAKAKERLNATLNQFGMSNQKISVESIAQRLASRQVAKNEPYEGVFTAQGVVSSVQKEFGLVTRSIPVSKQTLSKGSKPMNTQINFYSQNAAKINKPMTQGGDNRVALDQKNGNDSVNTSILSYNTQQLKGSMQAQYAIQNYMRNRASMQADNKQATVNNYFGDDGIYQNGFLNQSQQIANYKVYRSKKPAPN